MKRPDDTTKTPVARLHQLLQKAKNQPNPYQPVRLWANVFDVSVSGNDVKEDQLLAVLERLQEFRTLIDETEEGLRELREIEPRYLEPIKPVRKVLFSSLLMLNQNVSGLLNPVTERHMTLLELASSEWSRRKPEVRVDEQQLQDILKQTRELFETVKAASDISDELRKAILSMLASVEHAIQEYRIVGPSALEKGVIHLIGQWRWYERIFKKTPKDSTGRSLVKKVGAIGAAMLAIMTFANTTHKTIETFAPDVLFLTAGDPEIPPVDLNEEQGDRQGAPAIGKHQTD